MKQTTMYLLCLFAVIIVATGGIYFYANRHKTTPSTSSVSGCRAQTFTTSASGQCVKDIQTMTDYMETAGLTECPFTGGKVIPITGMYDRATQAQVKVVQNWANCYYNQEGMNMSVTANGEVDNNTWTELCDFAYTSPKQSGTAVSSYTKASISAGGDAHC